MELIKDFHGRLYVKEKKKKYTMRDAKALIINSLFNGGPTLDLQKACRILVLSAAIHDTDWSRAVYNSREYKII